MVLEVFGRLRLATPVGSYSETDQLPAASLTDHQVSYALTLPWTLSPSSLTSIALLQFASDALRLSFGEWQMRKLTSPMESSHVAEQLYIALEMQNQMACGDTPYPNPLTSSAEGMKLTIWYANHLCYLIAPIYHIAL